MKDRFRDSNSIDPTKAFDRAATYEVESNQSAQDMLTLMAHLEHGRINGAPLLTVTIGEGDDRILIFTIPTVKSRFVRSGLTVVKETLVRHLAIAPSGFYALSDRYKKIAPAAIDEMRNPFTTNPYYLASNFPCMLRNNAVDGRTPGEASITDGRIVLRVDGGGNSRQIPRDFLPISADDASDMYSDITGVYIAALDKATQKHRQMQDASRDMMMGSDHEEVSFFRKIKRKRT